MQDIHWNCCPLVAQNPITRAFIEQMAKERKSKSTIENYSRDLNDFLTAFADTPFADLLEADESRLHIMLIGSGSETLTEHRDRGSINVRSPTSPAPNLPPPRSGVVSVLCAAFTVGVSGSGIGEIRLTQFSRAYADKREGLSLFRPQSPGYQTSANGKPF